MKLSDITTDHLGQTAHLTVNGRTYTGPIRHIRSHHFPGMDQRLAGAGTPPPDKWTVDVQLASAAFEGLSPDTEIELLPRLPGKIPASGNHFPNDAFEGLTGGTIEALTHGLESTVKLADGRTGTYELEPAPGSRGGTWILRH